jgi:uncharacterized membrane protein
MFISVVAACALVRLACIFGDLWLDEIWSVRLVSEIASWEEVFTRIVHDNNHPLNSIYLFLLFPAPADWMYRLLSVTAGSAAVAVAGLIGRMQWQLLFPEDAKGCRAAGLLTAGIIGASYLMIHYSAEARGYAPAVLFCLLALLSLLHANQDRSNRWALVYWAACVLGLLAHFTMVQVVLAGLLASLMQEAASKKSLVRRLLRLTYWQLLPCTFLCLYYLGFVRNLNIGGGTNNPLLGVLGEAAAYSLGFPAAVGTALALPLMLLLSIVALLDIWQRQRFLAVFYAAAIFVIQAASMLGTDQFTQRFPRYFTISAALTLLLIAHVLLRLWNSKPSMHIVIAALVVAFVIGNGIHASRLIRFGMGQYQRALRHIVARTPGEVITVSSDHDFRNFAMIGYYSSVAGPGKSIEYIRSGELPMTGTQWLILHHLAEEGPMARSQFDAWQNRYELDGIFPHAALSGWDWYVYRNVEFLPPATRDAADCPGP